MNRCGNESVRFGEQLSHLYLIILLDYRLRGFSDVHGKRENHLSFRVEEAQTAFPAQVLVAFRMNAAAKCVFHCSADSFLLLDLRFPVNRNRAGPERYPQSLLLFADFLNCDRFFPVFCHGLFYQNGSGM